MDGRDGKELGERLAVGAERHSPLPGFSDLFLNEASDIRFAGEHELVFGYEQLIIHPGKSIFDKGLVLSSAEEKTDGRVIALTLHVLVVPTHVGVELAEILVCEFLYFQLDQYVAFENAVVKHEINEPVSITNEDTLLTSLEAESVTQFEQEFFQIAEQTVFKIGFAHNFSRLDSEKFEDVGITNS
jgi:hypothetical protein